MYESTILISIRFLDSVQNLLGDGGPCTGPSYVLQAKQTQLTTHKDPKTKGKKRRFKKFYSVCVSPYPNTLYSLNKVLNNPF